MSDTQIKIGSLVKITFLENVDLYINSPSGRGRWSFNEDDIQYGEIHKVLEVGEIVVKLGRYSKTEPISLSNPNINFTVFEPVLRDD